MRGWRRLGGALCVALLLSAAGAWGQENLLKNPGFEVFDQGLPVDWSAFVMPQEGALADLDRTRACQGRNSVVLCTSKPYETDPFNNWNQNVVGSFSGKTLVLSGTIRTEEAGQAVLWLQCWRKNPWSVLLAASSGTTTPVSGTQNWTRVEVKASVPAGTDYVTARCVLKGTGKAWFDDLSLVAETPPPKAAPAAPAPSQPAPVAPTPPVPPQRPAQVTAKPPIEQGPRTEKDVQELVNANKALMESYQALRETNEALGEQLKSLQREVSTLRRQVRQQAGKAAAPERAFPEPPVAPTVQSPEPPWRPEPLPPPLVPSTIAGQEDER